MAALSLGIIGCGNMGGAIARGVLSSPGLKESFVVGAYDITEAARKEMEQAGGIWHTQPEDLAAACDLVLLAVKPYQLAAVMQQIRPSLRADKTLLSIAAGQPLSALRAALAGVCAAVQVMPNTPALVNDGVFGLCFDDPALPDERKRTIRRLFSALGTVFILPESRMNALMAVTGAGPAYVFDMMDAVMEAAVTLGFTRSDASDMVVALFRGAAGMVGATGQHPAVLHSQVTSPGGATIVGTNHLARAGMRGAIIDAILATAARGKAMEQE
ncbi:pyrroline-5-carboxylate reductase [Deltaproteobacteria bacterium]|nr:pyrroline-5-carboxylate reductase [Deltaproteobacteria bacterium]